MNGHHIKVLGKVFTVDDYRQSTPQVLALLSKAHGQDNRALCLCTATPQPLYIAKRAGTFYLAKMPETGSFHDSGCDFYDTPKDQTGRSSLDEDAIVEEGGKYNVKLGFQLVASRQVRTPTERGSAPASTDSTRRSSLHLVGMLHFLWESSRNTLWFPYIKGRPNEGRTWGQAHFFLSNLVANTFCKKEPLSKSLYIAPSYRPDRAAEIRQEWDAAMKETIESGMAAAEAKQLPQLKKLILGEVTKIRESKYSFSIRVKGIERDIYISHSLYAALTKQAPLAMQIAQGEIEEAKCVMLAICQSSKRGDMVVSDIALMPTNRHFIPITKGEDCGVLDALVSHGRLFEKTMDYGNTDLSLPDFVLLDGQEKRIPMFVLTKDAAPRRLELLRRAIDTCRKDGQPVWVWDQHSSLSMPDLPHKRVAKPRTEAAEEA